MADRESKQTCVGAPPSRPGWWDITPRTGKAKRGFGQTAFVAAENAGVLLSEILEMHLSDDQAAPVDLGSTCDSCGAALAHRGEERTCPVCDLDSVQAWQEELEIDRGSGVEEPSELGNVDRLPGLGHREGDS